jgi:hypothetical protein
MGLLSCRFPRGVYDQLQGLRGSFTSGRPAQEFVGPLIQHLEGVRAAARPEMRVVGVRRGAISVGALDHAQHVRAGDLDGFAKQHGARALLRCEGAR